MSLGKVMIAALAGLATGAALGILLAPDKGSNTRKKISKKKEKYVDDMKDKFNELIDTFSEKLDSVKDHEDDMIEKGRSKLQYAKMK